jgi:nucleotide-binding universal stress UspA family protein
MSAATSEEKPIMKILLPVDGSQAAEHAAKALIRYLPNWRSNPEIELMFVSLPIRALPTFRGSTEEKEIIEKYYQTEADQAKAGVKNLLKAAHVEFTESSAVGEPAEELCKAAKERKCDMIWMGTRGLSTLGNLLLGSIATKVVHRSTVPVVLVRPEGASRT